MLQIFHFENALAGCRSREADAATVRSAKRHPHEAIIMHHLNEAELIRLRNSLVHIAEDVVENTNSQCKPKTILSWAREFLKLGGHFKRDERSVHERNVIMGQEDLQLQLLGWLKGLKRVTTDKTQKYINNVLFAGEGEM